MMNQLNEQELICSNCKNEFDENIHLPRMLPECGHTFCNQCLLVFLEESDLVECPEDNIVSSRKEVVSFPKNYSLINILRKKRKSSSCYSSPSQILFENNNNTNTPQKKEQSSCSSSRKNSVNSFSLSNGMRGSIEQDDLQQQQIQKNKRKCTEHKKEKDIVCMDCQLAICSSCALFGMHKKHDVSSEEDVMKIISQRAEELLNVYELIEEEFNIIKSSSYKDLIHSYKSNNLSNIIKQVDQYFNDMIKLVEERKGNILKEIENIFKQQESMLLKAIDLSQQNVLTEIEEWQIKAKEQIKNLCDKSQGFELSFDLIQNKSKSQIDIIEVGKQIKKKIEINQNQFQDQIKQIELEEIKLEFNSNIKNIIENLIQIKVIGNNNNSDGFESLNLYESLKLSEIQQKTISRSGFRRGSQYKKAKKYLDSFYNSNKKDKSHYPLKNNDKIFEAVDLLESINTEKQSELQQQDSLFNIKNNNDNFNEDNHSQIEQLILSKQDNSILINQQDICITPNQNIQNNENHDQNISPKMINNNQQEDEQKDEDYLLQSQVISNEFTSCPIKLNEQIQQQKYLNNNNNYNNNNINNALTNQYHFNQNVIKLCTNEDDENLISQINNKDFLLTSLSYQNFSLNDINLLDDQTNLYDNNTGHIIDHKKMIFQSLTTNAQTACDANLMNTEISQFDDNPIDESNYNNNPQAQYVFNMKEQAKFLNIIQEIFSNTIDTADFSHMDIGDKGIDILQIALKENNSLNTIKLNQNEITDDGFIRFIDLIDHSCYNIKNIFFERNKITEKSLHKLNELKLKKERELSNIYLKDNKINNIELITSVKSTLHSLHITLHI